MEGGREGGREEEREEERKGGRKSQLYIDHNRCSYSSVRNCTRSAQHYIWNAEMLLACYGVRKCGRCEVCVSAVDARCA